MPLFLREQYRSQSSLLLPGFTQAPLSGFGLRRFIYDFSSSLILLPLAPSLHLAILSIIKSAGLRQVNQIELFKRHNPGSGVADCAASGRYGRTLPDPAALAGNALVYGIQGFNTAPWDAAQKA